MSFRNIRLKKLKFVSSFRRIAIGSWRAPRHPAVYSLLDLPVDNVIPFLKENQSEGGPVPSMTHFVAKVMAHVLKTFPDLNRIVRCGTLAQRSDIDLFFPVTMRSKTGFDLSGICIRNVDGKSLGQLAREVHQKSWQLRRGNDVEIRRVQKLLCSLPVRMSRLVISVMDFWGYTLNLNPKMVGAPKDRFGSAIISSLGGFGLESTLLQLFPFSRTPICIGIGKVTDKVVPSGDEIIVAPYLTLGITIDHRIIDGRHAGEALRMVRRIFQDPKRYSEFFVD